ncbi:Fic family protein [uncultured Lamprocystis sp.]|jgi:predicted HTH transcriptional regulator|uniref:Fic family protein n=1 Tax=uncultured Lamprocystis sp. TaxID=543132 RepID=UPI0025FAB992|nr:ATP-binding protein [uncultured Lamprocystis sp.]
MDRETLLDFDAKLVDSAGPGDLDADSLNWLRARVRSPIGATDWAKLSDQEWLQRLGLMRGDRLTRAALLLCGDMGPLSFVNPTPRVDFRRMNYPSTDPVHEERWSDREVVDGNIVQALRLLLDRFERLVPNPFALEVDGFTRRAVGPHLAPLREALVNLLVHQDHGDHRIARVLWYSDKILFENPGDSLVPLQELLAGGATDCRNPTVQRAMRMAQLAEQAGSGVVGLCERWEGLTGQVPVIANDPAGKTYAIELPWPQEQATERVTPQVTLQVPPQVTQQVSQLVEALDGEMTRGDLLERLGLKDRMHFVSAYLTPALDFGVVEMTIPDKPRSSRQKYRLTESGRVLAQQLSNQPREREEPK